MGRVRYIGSKARIVSHIMDRAGVPNGGRFFDMFSGTGSVSREAALRGWPVRANDHLAAAAILTASQLLCSDNVPYRHFGGYQAAVEQLNEARPRAGFIFREYSPSGASRSKHERQYFTCENAKRIDGMRAAIETWYADGQLSHNEHTLLIADLMEAANQIANIAGTYGCFMGHWTASSLRPIRASTRELLPSPCKFEVSTSDVFDLRATAEDVVYLDPPYTKRQYASYYHILETIALGDAPLVDGVAGLRPWRAKASPFCYRKHALAAMLSLLQCAKASRVLISYNSEGQMSVSELSEQMKALGTVRVHEVGQIGRYRPNYAATMNGSTVTEYLIELHAATSVVASRPVLPTTFYYRRWAEAAGACT